jgi:hypothetical protein
MPHFARNRDALVRQRRHGLTTCKPWRGNLWALRRMARAAIQAAAGELSRNV